MPQNLHPGQQDPNDQVSPPTAAYKHNWSKLKIRKAGNLADVQTQLFQVQRITEKLLFQTW